MMKLQKINLENNMIKDHQEIFLMEFLQPPFRCIDAINRQVHFPPEILWINSITISKRLIHRDEETVE